MEDKVLLQMSAIDQYVKENIPTAEEIDVNGKDFVAYGKDNAYVDFLYDLYENVATLQSVINGTVDYVCGDKIECIEPSFTNSVNRRGETMEDLIGKLASDYCIFGGAYIQVIRNNAGDVCELYWLDYRNVRTDKKNEAFFYSQDWSKSYGRVKYNVYPRFMIGASHPSSVMFIKNKNSRGAYATPIWNSAIISAEIEKSINEYHLNSINNGFTSSFMVNLNNGVPSDAIKSEIEKNFESKFSGKENAGRILISYNSDKEHQCEITPFEIQDFGEKYNTLAARSRQQIAISFGCNLSLFGCPIEGTGFNSQEYESQFQLYNRTRVVPIQKTIINAINKVLGMECVVITPFSLNNNTNVE